MGTTAEKLQAIVDSKNDISSAIIAKHGTVPNQLSGYADSIRSLPDCSIAGIVPTDIWELNGNGSLYPTYDSFDVKITAQNLVDPYGLFGLYRCKRVRHLDMTSVVKIQGNGQCEMMFANSYIKSANLNNLQTLFNVDTCKQMFYQCSYLSSVSCDSLSTMSGNNMMESMFEGSSIRSISFNSLPETNGWNMDRMCYGCKSLSSFSFNAMKTIGSYGMNRTFSNCTALSSAIFPVVEEIKMYEPLTYCFEKCTALGSVSFPVLKCVSGTNTFKNAFSGCTVLSSICFDNLESIGYDLSGNQKETYGTFNYALYNVGSISALSFPKLQRIYQSNSTASYACFYYNNKIKRIDMKSLSAVEGTGTNNLFNSCTSLTELHFGAENQSAIESMPGYATLWGRGAGKATVYFDL